MTITSRDEGRGDKALHQVRAKVDGATADARRLDLADLGSVRDFADEYAEDHGRLDLLVNNAGVMALPRRQTTADGFERQLGTNHLGHFALTGRLLPLLEAADAETRDGRVVTVSSNAHRAGRIRRDDLMREPATGRGPPTASPSWPTCCSPTSCSGAARTPAAASRPLRLTRASQPRTSSAPAR